MIVRTKDGGNLPTMSQLNTILRGIGALCWMCTDTQKPMVDTLVPCRWRRWAASAQASDGKYNLIVEMANKTELSQQCDGLVCLSQDWGSE